MTFLAGCHRPWRWQATPLRDRRNQPFTAGIELAAGQAESNKTPSTFMAENAKIAGKSGRVG
jgi:hypothetical protein